MKRISAIFGFILSVFIFLPLFSYSQAITHLEIIHADKLIGTTIGNQKIRKLIHHVILSHAGVIMYCDSAFDYLDEDYFLAFGNIRMLQGDTIVILGKKLRYDIRHKTSNIEDQVELHDRQMVLYTNRLFYDLNTGTSYFEEGATIKETKNTLTSKKGYYSANTKTLFFKDQVLLVNDQFRLTTDSLRFNTLNHTANFICPTHIQGEKTRVYCEDGWYNTFTMQSHFAKNAHIKSGNKIIYGDHLYYNDKTKNGKGLGNINIWDSIEKISVCGQYSQHFNLAGISYVTDSAVGIRYMDNDTMYLHADTLKFIKDTINKVDIMEAYYHAKVFSTGLRLKCDSLSYTTKDSIIRFYYDPIMWNQNNQITAKNIHLTTKNNKFDKMYMDDDAFMIGKNDSICFDQIKGRKMIGYFIENELKVIDVNGNAQAIYYLKDKDKKYVGINKIESGFMKIHLKNKAISDITFMGTPGGTVHPPSITAYHEGRLKGFKWREKERPDCIEDIFTRR